MARGRSRFVWVLLAGAAVPAFGSKSLTVDQFDHLLTAQRGKSDSKLARQIATVELSERASPARLAQWESEFPGVRNSLIAIADASQFLPPCAADELKDPAPGLETQEKMVSMAIGYVSTTLPKLPDFFATRETMHFESAQFSQNEPLHFLGRSSLVVSYSDGREVRDVQSPPSRAQAAAGLTTTGEFGPILSIVLGDAVHGKLQWGYWERSALPVAVFRYSVPRQESHYTLTFPHGRQSITLNPAYHGEIALDPATGEILRLTLISDLPVLYQQVVTGMMVEYAHVAIGDRRYICPVLGVALSRFPVPGNVALSRFPVSWSGGMQTQLNDVSFTHYHLLRAETRILP